MLLVLPLTVKVLTHQGHYHEEPHYVLHVGAPGAVHKSPQVGGRARRWVVEQLKVLALSSAIFIVAFVGLNWGAISANVAYYYQKWHGTSQGPFTTLVQGPVSPKRAKLLPVAEQSQAAPLTADRVPPLYLEVTPPDARLVVPRINQNVPVIGVNNANLIARDWDALEDDIQGALRSGIVHYPGTALPGESGNVVLTGHSSYYAWDAGRFKDVFALLHDVQLGDRIIFYYNQKKYTYEVFDIKVVRPEQVDVLAPTGDERLTLITCTPIGTNAKRLIVSAKEVE